MSNPKTVILTLTCAIAIAGEVLRKGSLVEVTTEEARDLLHGGKAVVYEGDVDSNDKVFASDTVDPALHPDIALHRQDAADQAATDTAARIAAFDAANPAVSPQAQEGAQEGAQAAPVVAAATPAPVAADAPQAAAKPAAKPAKPAKPAKAD